VSGLLWTALGVLGGLGMTAIGDMVSEEVRDRLDHLPYAILRLAARQLDDEQRVALYVDQWLPELIYILKGNEARPITRLYHGTRFALGILAAVRRITAELGKPSPVMAALARLGAAVIEVKLLAAGISALEGDLDLAIEQLHRLRSSRAATFTRAFSQARLQWQIRVTRNGLMDLHEQRDRIERNVIEAKMAGSLGELLSKVEGVDSSVDWTYLEREIGRRSKSRPIRRMSQKNTFPADHLGLH
jgi:hypothetical protein